jgi:outer membrane protein OmpA-like peptidoglycan-associated protein
MNTTNLAKALLATFLSLAATFASAQGGDHPLVGRYEGAKLIDHHATEFDEVEVISEPIGGSQRGPAVPGWTRLEGKTDLYYYSLPQGRSSLEVLRNYQSGLGTKGFETVFSCATSDGSCYVNIPGRSANTAPYDFALAYDASPELPRLNSDFIRNYFRINARYLLAKKSGADGTYYASIVIAESGERGNFAFVRVVQTKAMEQNKISFVGADEMRSSINANGRISLYGIQFDFDRDTIRPDSKPTLDEIAKLLRADAALRLAVVGHTDSKGDDAYNLDLSKRRAAAVVASLGSMGGIDSARLQPRGAGAGEPVASNDDEASRAKNRRVVLVRLP